MVFGQTKPCFSVRHQPDGHGGTVEAYEMSAVYFTRKAVPTFIRPKGLLCRNVHVCVAGIIQSYHPVAAQAFAPAVYIKNARPWFSACLVQSPPKSRVANCESCGVIEHHYLHCNTQFLEKIASDVAIKLGVAAHPSTGYPALLS